MAMLPDAVPEEALDYDEILRRGGANCGDEDFALCKCPHCGRIYLIEYEVDTIYLDPEDLGRRVGININVSSFVCEGCGTHMASRSLDRPEGPNGHAGLLDRIGSEPVVVDHDSHPGRPSLIRRSGQIRSDTAIVASDYHVVSGTGSRPERRERRDLRHIAHARVAVRVRIDTSNKRRHHVCPIHLGQARRGPELHLATVLLGDDVINLKGQGISLLREPAVLAESPRSIPHAQG